MKKTYLLCIATAIVMVLLSFGVHSMTRKEAKNIKVGFIFISIIY